MLFQWLESEDQRPNSDLQSCRWMLCNSLYFQLPLAAKPAFPPVPTSLISTTVYWPLPVHSLPDFVTPCLLTTAHLSPLSNHWITFPVLLCLPGFSILCLVMCKKKNSWSLSDTVSHFQPIIIIVWNWLVRQHNFSESPSKQQKQSQVPGVTREGRRVQLISPAAPSPSSPRPPPLRLRALPPASLDQWLQILPRSLYLSPLSLSPAV